MFWEFLAYTTIREIDRRTPLIINIGSIEQHGPALPVSTDSLIGWKMVEELEKRMPDKVLVLPQVKIAYSQHHMDFPGSITVSHETLMHYIEDIVDSVVHHGFRNILLFNSHGGNQATVQVLVEKLGNKYPHVNMMGTTWWNLCGDFLSEICESGIMGNGHAAEFEFSLIESICPEKIDYQKKSAGSRPNVGLSWSTNDLIHASKVSLQRTFREMTLDGTFGLTENANADKGKRILAAVNDRFVSLINDIWELPLRK